MNRAEMREEVRERIGERSENFWTDSFINRALRQGNIRFNKEERWPWLLTVKTAVAVAEDSTEITLEAGVDLNRTFGLILVPDLVGDQRHRVPTRVSVPNGLKIAADFSSNLQLATEPEYFYLYSATNGALKLRLAPKADKDYVAEYHYYRAVTEMDADVDEPDMPEEYHDAVVCWATATCWKKELNGDTKAQSEFNQYQAILDQARQDLKEVADDHIVEWGGAEPEYRVWDENDWLRARIGPLGV